MDDFYEAIGDYDEDEMFASWNHQNELELQEHGYLDSLRDFNNPEFTEH